MDSNCTLDYLREWCQLSNGFHPRFSETMGTSRLKKKTKNSKREISADERANESIKKSLAELASIFRREDESDTSLDEEDLLSMAVDYLKMAAATEKVTKRSRHEKEEKWAHRKKRKSRNTKKGSKVKEAPSHASHSNSSTEICWESALEGYVTGYKDCSQEAVRYLLEEEGLTPTDQIVIGLQNHLRDNEVGIDNNNRKSVESLVGQTLVCFNSSSAEATASPSSTSQQLPPIHELMSTSLSAFPTSSSCTNSLPQGSMTALTLATPGKQMEPLTVDTNQEYELPSPLQRGAEAAKKSKESLLTIAHTQPTISTPVYTHSLGHQVTPVTITAPMAPMAMSCATQRLGLEKAMATSLNTVGGQAYGFNLNYAAPYVYAWVKPAQQ